jgi:hypothetical protein
MVSLNDKQSQSRSMWPAGAAAQDVPPTSARENKLPIVRVGSDLTVTPVEGEEASLREFARAWEFIGAAVDRDGEQDMASVLKAMARGTRQLWVSDTSAVITEVLRYPSGLQIVNGWLAGGDVKEIESWLPMLEGWGKERGATQARANGRRGWKKPTGYKEFRVSMYKDL